MKTRVWTITAALAIATASVHMVLTRAAGAQTRRDAPQIGRTPWGDPDVQGEWTSEGEYGVPIERPPQFGTRQFLTGAEYARSNRRRNESCHRPPFAPTWVLRAGGGTERRWWLKLET